MGQANRFAPLVVLLILFVVLQAAFIAFDYRQTPAKAAKAFIKDYYQLDPGMQQWLCTEKRAAGLVQNYLQTKADEAAQEGYRISYFRRMFTKLHVNTIRQEGDRALVHVIGTTRVAINPAFMVIGKIFGIGKDYPVDTTLGLIRQEGRWRVCDGAFYNGFAGADL